MDRELALARAWLCAQRIDPEPALEVHPDDDMRRADVQQSASEQRLLEYLRSGHEAVLVLENALRAAGRELARVESMLDFAGGYGRVLRHLVQRVPRERIAHSDVLAPALEFVRGTFGVHSFASATDIATLRFPRRYELVFCASLFSHLSRARFGPALRALYGALEPNGLLVFSTHSPRVLEPAQRDPSGYTFVPSSESRVLAGEEYGSSWIEPELVRELCVREGSEHLAVLERELWRIQDVWIVSREPLPGLARWRPAPVARGSILRATLAPDGHAWIGGFVRIPREHAPPRELRVDVRALAADRAAGGRSFAAALREHEQPLAPSEGGERMRQFDWFLEGPAQELAREPQALCASAQLAGGERSCFAACALGG